MGAHWVEGRKDQDPIRACLTNCETECENLKKRHNILVKVAITKVFPSLRCLHDFNLRFAALLSHLKHVPWLKNALLNSPKCVSGWTSALRRRWGSLNAPPPPDSLINCRPQNLPPVNVISVSSADWTPINLFKLGQSEWTVTKPRQHELINQQFMI